MIEAHGLVKRYGSTTAVNDLSFSIRPGMVDEPVNGLDPDGIHWVRPSCGAGRRGPHPAGFQPPDERDGPDR